MFSHLQFEFLKGRSTSLQLRNIMNDWTNSIENEIFKGCIYLDYQKALDTVPHNRLISKLYSYNLDARIIKLHNHMSRKRSLIRRRKLPTHRKRPIICRKTDPTYIFLFPMVGAIVLFPLPPQRAPMVMSISKEF